jgi:hypothetical protein
LTIPFFISFFGKLTQRQRNVAVSFDNPGTATFIVPLSFPLSMLLRISQRCRSLHRPSIHRHLGATAKTKPYLSDATTTHFGFSDVPIEQKESKVRHVFENVADSYDVMNDFMSAGLHRVWKDYFTSLLQMEKMAQQARHGCLAVYIGRRGRNGRYFLSIFGASGMHRTGEKQWDRSSSNNSL